MRVTLEKGLNLVITPESYTEEIALGTWSEKHGSQPGLLIKAYDPTNAPDDEKFTTISIGAAPPTSEEIERLLERAFRQLKRP